MHKALIHTDTAGRCEAQPLEHAQSRRPHSRSIVLHNHGHKGDDARGACGKISIHSGGAHLRQLEHDGLDFIHVLRHARLPEFPRQRVLPLRFHLCETKAQSVVQRNGATTPHLPQ